MLACLFIFGPADDRSGLNRTNNSRKRIKTVEKRNTFPKIYQKYETVVELGNSVACDSKWTRAKSLL